MLTIRKGQEHSLVITPRLDDPDDLMHSAYRQALDALHEIVRQAKKIPAPGDKDKASKLYGYTHNIIAFSGSRGQGKTSSMLSFSGAMHAGCSQSCHAGFGMPEDCSFTILPPFDPTVLEGDQSILAVILSRMYRLAEETWKEDGCLRSEAEKNELLELFQRCLSGINSIKFRRGKEIQTLHAIHEISDSSILKENFYKLTGKLLRFLGRNSQARSSFLVVQLDDTDFQIRKGYEILEDIRKYLTLPNVIILMATDLDMLRHALTQHYIGEFQQGLDQKILRIDDLRKLESKYLDKLIPPTFAVYLPQLDDMIRQRNDLIRLAYIDPEEETRALEERRNPVNLLLRPGCSCRTEDFSFQSLLLRYIYRKTRIVFAEHRTYMHNLIPTTLRGLAQLLGVLVTMRDVPEIESSDPRLENPRELAKLVQQQVDILDVNLPRFEDYFLNDWVHTKLSQENAAVIERLAGALPEQRCQLAVTLLEDLYEKAGEEETETEPNAAEAEDDYTTMIDRLQKWKERHRRIEDFYLFFAVHTFFTIQAHKTVVRQKRCAITAFLKTDAAVSGYPDEAPPLLLFDFSPESTNLPAWFKIPSLPEKAGGYKIKDTLSERDYDNFFGKVGNHLSNRFLFQKCKNGSYHFCIENFIGLFLSLGSPEGLPLADGNLSQKDLYLTQTSAATIAINWDVQDKLRKLTDREFEWGDSAPTYSTALRNVWEIIDRTIESINPCMRPDNPCLMVTSRLRNMVNFIDGNDSRSDLQRVLRTVDMYFGEDYLEMICDIYRCTQNLRAQVQKDKSGENEPEIRAAANALIEVLWAVSLPSILGQFDKESVLKKLDAYLVEAVKAKRSNAKSLFTKTINTQMKNLCAGFGYTTDEIERLLARKDRP